MVGSVVVTQAGRVEGTSHDGYERFLGIPYAAPPVGELRFRRPQPPVPIDGVLLANAMPPHAPQLPSPLEDVLGEGAAMTISEGGCLALNVWTPRADAAVRPVMVFLHGGAFVWGSCAVPMYDGARFAQDHDVVVVSLNYRLGAVGYSYCGDVGGVDFVGSGSLGVLDAAAALRWVAANVSSFGGDPTNVTVFGESAGAMNIGTLLAIPEARGLFHKAILQSGAASSVGTKDEAAAYFEELCELLDTAHDVAAVQAVPVERLLEAQAALMARHERNGLVFRPIVDGVVLDRPPLEAVAAGASTDVSLLIGTNLDEWRLFSTFDPTFAQQDDDVVRTELTRLCPGDPDVVAATYRKRLGEVPATRVLESALTDATFRDPAIRLAEAQVNAGGQAWMYLFTWASPALGGVFGSCHGLELPFVFNTLDAKSSQLFTGEDPPGDLARGVSATWAAFARHGDPGLGSLGAWPRYDVGRRATMVLDRVAKVEDDPLREERLLWQR